MQTTEQCLSCALDLRPLQQARELPDVYFNLSLKRIRQERWAEAMLAAATASFLQPRDMEAKALLVSILGRLGGEEIINRFLASIGAREAQDIRELLGAEDTADA